MSEVEEIELDTQEQFDAMVKKLHAVSSLDRDKTMLAQSLESFKDHQIQHQSDNRWVIARKHEGGGWSSIYLAEIIILWGGSILVHGDIDHVIFSSYGDSTKPLHVLEWMARHTDIRSYVHQKATIGTGHQLIDEIDPSVFAYDVLSRAFECVQDWRETGDHPGEHYEEKNLWLDAVYDIYCGNHHEEVKKTLYEEGVESELLGGLGEVVTPRVYFAHAAIRKLCSLLGGTT